MIPAILLLLFYIGFLYFGYSQTIRVRDELIRLEALSPEQAVNLDRSRFVVLTTLFFFTAIHEEDDERLWLEIAQWRNMMSWFIGVVVISVASFLLLIFSYI